MHLRGVVARGIGGALSVGAVLGFDRAGVEVAIERKHSEWSCRRMPARLAAGVAIFGFYACFHRRRPVVGCVSRVGCGSMLHGSCS